MKAQDLNSEVWRSSSRNGLPLSVKRLPIPFCRNALAKLVEAHGESVTETTLGRALAHRVALDGSVFEPNVSAIGGGGMLRGTAGRFVGASSSSLVVVHDNETEESCSSQ